MENSIKYLYQLMFNNYKKIDLYEISSSIINFHTQIPNCFLNKSLYYPEIIRDDIINNASYKYENQIKIKNKIITIHFITYKPISVKNINLYFKMCYLWLNIIIYSNCLIKNCCNKLDIYIAFSKINKVLPENSNNILSSENINTGYSYTCKENNEIIIYRQEDWFKVFIHETFHAFDLDSSSLFSSSSNYEIRLKEKFNIKNKILIYECYTEMWARILNVLLLEFIKNKNYQDEFLFTSFYNKCKITFQNEATFSVIQSVKVLKYMGINYNILISNDEKLRQCSLNLYKENTHVFCYYILTSILFLNLDSFLLWCNKNNNELFCFTKSSKNIDKFIDLILLLYNKKELLEIFENAYKKKTFKNKSLRMSEIYI